MLDLEYIRIPGRVVGRKKDILVSMGIVLKGEGLESQLNQVSKKGGFVMTPSHYFKVVNYLDEMGKFFDKGCEYLSFLGILELPSFEKFMDGKRRKFLGAPLTGTWNALIDLTYLFEFHENHFNRVRHDGFPDFSNRSDERGVVFSLQMPLDKYNEGGSVRERRGLVVRTGSTPFSNRFEFYHPLDGVQDIGVRPCFSSTKKVAKSLRVVRV